MNRILKMASKDLKLLLRDKMGAFFIFGFPIAMGLFFGLMYPGAPSSNATSKMKIVMVDQDQTEMSKVFLGSLANNENLALSSAEEEAIETYLKNNPDFDREDAEVQWARDQVRLGRKAGMVLIPKGFGARAGVFWGEAPDVHVGMDQSRGAEKAMMEGFVMEAMGQIFSSRFQDPQSFMPDVEQARKELAEADDMDPTQKLLVSGFLGTVETLIGSAQEIQGSGVGDSSASSESDGNAGLKFANIIRDDVTQSVDPNSVKGQTLKLRSKWDISFPQAMLWGVLGCVAGFAISIAKERSEGTMVRLQVAPLSKLEILLGKALACFLSVLLVIAMMTALGWALGMKPLSYPKLAFAAVCMAVCFVGIMMFMSVLGKTEQSVSGSGWAINMVMAMLGGCMIPVMFMPEFLQNLSFISPIRWAIQAVEGAIWRDFTWLQMLTPCAILVVVGLVGLGVGTKVLSRE